MRRRLVASICAPTSIARPMPVMIAIVMRLFFGILFDRIRFAAG
jgi:hypothetical protein